MAFLNTEDVTRCLGVLSKLERHLEGSVILTGGIATAWQLLSCGRSYQQRSLNDIDVVVEDLQYLPPSLSADFLINHFHPTRGRGRILIQLVDEEFCIRIDVFTPTTPTLMRRLKTAVGRTSCRLVSTEDISAKLLSVIYAVTKGELVDPKYVEHFHLLFSVVDLVKTREVWREYRKEDQAVEFDEAVEAVERSIAVYPNLLQASSYSQDLNRTCQWCCDSEKFPIAPAVKVCEILGHV
jgi:hypothetical protein